MSGFIKALLSKLAALAILAALIAGGVNWIVNPLSARLLDSKDHLSEQRTLLGRLQQSAAIDKDIAAVAGKGAGGESRAFLAGETDAIRIAGLQSTLNEAAETAGVRIASARALDPSEKSGLRLLGVMAQFSANLDQVQKILFFLEKQRPNLLVDQLHVASSPQAKGQGLPALDIAFVLSGAAPLEKGQP
jgi:hypothetical protein